MFKVTYPLTNGLHIITKRRTISIIWGAGTYSDNYDAPIGRNEPKLDSTRLELGIWINKSHKWVTNKYTDCGDSVAGYLSVQEVVDVIIKVADQQKEKELAELARSWPPMAWISELKAGLDPNIIDGNARRINTLLELPDASK